MRMRLNTPRPRQWSGVATLIERGGSAWLERATAMKGLMGRHASGDAVWCGETKVIARRSVNAVVQFSEVNESGDAIRSGQTKAAACSRRGETKCAAASRRDTKVVVRFGVDLTKMAARLRRGETTVTT